MSVLGRSSGLGGVEQLAAAFNTNITSADVEKVVYYNNGASEWQLLTGIDVTQITQNLIGVISAVTVDGDTIGGLGAGFITIRGAIAKAGAVPGQVFFVGTAADLVLTPPVGEAAIRMGYSRQAGFVYIDVDPDSIQIAILSDQVVSLQSDVATLQQQVTDLQDVFAITPVYDFGADDNWSANAETTATNFGADDGWTEGVVEYNTNFGADDAWGELVP